MKEERNEGRNSLSFLRRRDYALSYLSSQNSLLKNCSRKGPLCLGHLVEECGPHLELPDAVLHAEVAHQAHTLARVPAGPPDTYKIELCIRIHWIRIQNTDPAPAFQVNPDPDPGFWWPKLKKIIQVKGFFDQKLQFTYVQATEEAFSP